MRQAAAERLSCVATSVCNSKTRSTVSAALYVMPSFWCVLPATHLCAIKLQQHAHGGLLIPQAPAFGVMLLVCPQRELLVLCHTRSHIPPILENLMVHSCCPGPHTPTCVVAAPCWCCLGLAACCCWLSPLVCCHHCQLAGTTSAAAAADANGMEVDGQQQQQQGAGSSGASTSGRKLFVGCQELGYKRPGMKVGQGVLVT